MTIPGREHRLLVVEDAGERLDASVRGALASRQFSMRSLPWEAPITEICERETPHAVVAVAVPPTSSVTRTMEKWCTRPIQPPTLVILPERVDDSLMSLLDGISDDFLLSPVRPAELCHRLARLVDGCGSGIHEVRKRLTNEMAMTQLVGSDPVFLEAISRVPQFARSEACVMITGETGTGKELTARAIHFLSKRRDHPFIAVDCGALPDHLIENELFGHARGAYTDAHRDQRGLIAMAEGGTLFLDEVDSLSLPAQSKLLRFLQDRTFRPLGSDRFQQADVHLLAAGNTDVEDAVARGRFRSDLFYRLNVLRLQLPPLRRRRSDIPVLAAHFLHEYRTLDGRPVRGFSPSALRFLAAHDWPGNVRELANVVNRAFVTCEGTQILPSDIALPGAAGAAEEAPHHFRSARAAVVADFERRYVENLLRKHNGNVTRAAREANKERRAFGRLIKKHGIGRQAE